MAKRNSAAFVRLSIALGPARRRRGTPHNLDCPNNLPGIGVRGRTGSWIDRIGLGCGVAEIPTVNSANANQPDLRVAIRDYPSVVVNNDQILWRVELWNVWGEPPRPTRPWTSRCRLRPERRSNSILPSRSP
jgi:hypothetical protein